MHAFIINYIKKMCYLCKNLCLNMIFFEDIPLFYSFQTFCCKILILINNNINIEFIFFSLICIFSLIYIFKKR